MLSQKLDFIRGDTKRLSPEVNPGSVLFLNHVQLLPLPSIPALINPDGQVPPPAGTVRCRSECHPASGFKDMMLGLHILFHGTVMVQMLFMDVHQNSYMG